MVIFGMMKIFRPDTFKLLLVLFTSFSLEAKVPKINFDWGRRLPVTQICQDNGYLRPIGQNGQSRSCSRLDENSRERGYKEFCDQTHSMLKLPILKEEEIDLGHGRSILKTIRQPLFYSWKEGERKRSLNIPHCENNLIEEENQVFVRRRANAQEVLVYASLYQEGIRHITGEFPKLSRLVRSTKDDARSMKIFFKTPDCKRLKRDESSSLKRVFGGEGSGNTRIVLDIGMSRDRFESLNRPDTKYLGLFKMDSPLKKYTVKGKEIPRTLVRANCY